MVVHRFLLLHAGRGYSRPALSLWGAKSEEVAPPVAGEGRAGVAPAIEACG
jgi:hypothetical protein